MDNTAMKLVASPLLIWAASLVGRRWGQSVAGWLVGLPLTSGPVALFLALDYGPDFAGRAAIGSLAGTAVQAGFCFSYISTAHRFGWPIALAAATVAYAFGAFVFEIVIPPLTLTLAGLAAAFSGATLTAVLIQGCSLWLIRHSRAPSDGR